MTKKILLACAMAAALLPLGARADEPGTLGQCLADNTTGKDRKNLVEWIYVAISAHPLLKPLSKVEDADVDRTTRAAADLMTRLLTESCVNEVRAQIKAGNSQAVKEAFGYLGQVAMQGLMTDSQVQATMGRLEHYLDAKKLQSVMTAP